MTWLCSLLIFAVLSGYENTSNHCLTVGSYGNNTAMEKSLTYEKFDATKEYSFQMKDGQGLSIAVHSSRRRGSYLFTWK